MTKKSNKRPLWLSIIINFAKVTAIIITDIVLIASILLTFCYFHHVRMFWGKEEDEEILGTFSKNEENNKPIIDGDDTSPGDDHGDFGASFPERFVGKDEDAVYLTDDGEIREYALQNGVVLQEHPHGRFIHFYRSHDVYISLNEINTELFYEGTGKTYTVQYFVYDIYVRNLENIFTVHSANERPAFDLIDLGAENSGGAVIAAVNGDYMGNKNHCKVAVRNGNIYRFEDFYIESDICVLNFDGTVETYTPEEYDWEAIASKNPYQVWNFGPALLDKEAKAITVYDERSYDGNVIDKRHPRTSFGYYEPGHYSFIVVDGRSVDSDGVRIVQVAQLFEELGCVRAYNMDGGDSSQAYFMRDIIRIDEERELKGQDQRELYDIICIGEVKKDD